MNPMEMMLAEFDQEAVTTRRLLEAVPENRYDWRAHEKAMSLGDLGGHMGAVLSNMPQILSGESVDVSLRPPPEPAPTTQAEMLARFDQGISTSREWLSGLGDRIHEPWRMMMGEEQLMAMPRLMAIRSLLFNHIYHHRGQLAGYLRAAGEKVPSIYGPTADYNPFMA